MVRLDSTSEVHYYYKPLPLSLPSFASPLMASPRSGEDAMVLHHPLHHWAHPHQPLAGDFMANGVRLDSTTTNDHYYYKPVLQSSPSFSSPFVLSPLLGDGAIVPHLPWHPWVHPHLPRVSGVNVLEVDFTSEDHYTSKRTHCFPLFACPRLLVPPSGVEVPLQVGI